MQLQIETTAVCNARCTFCIYPTDLNSRPKGRMSMDLFRKIVDEASTIPQINDVCITGLSESLLDPDLEARIAHVREKIPEAFINSFTNGTYLTPERYESLQDAGLDMILVSINAVDAEGRKRIMGLDDFDKVVNQITEAIRREKTCKVHIRAVVSKDGTDRALAPKDSEHLYRIWGHRAEGGRVQSIWESNWTGHIPVKRDFQPNECCFRALDQIYVTFDGKVTTCCFDPLGAQVFGNLNTQGMREIYNSPEYVLFREDHDRNEADKYPICKGCSRI
jgi:radical SAM protein with 4Fe4S-binding SPASM domain